MSSHFFLACEHGYVVSQCRCPSRDKQVRYEDAPCRRSHDRQLFAPPHPPRPVSTPPAPAPAALTHVSAGDVAAYVQRSSNLDDDSPIVIVNYRTGQRAVVSVVGVTYLNGRPALLLGDDPGARAQADTSEELNRDRSA